VRHAIYQPHQGHALIELEVKYDGSWVGLLIEVYSCHKESIQ
jgi:hypothetical protein